MLNLPNAAPQPQDPSLGGQSAPTQGEMQPGIMEPAMQGQKAPADEEVFAAIEQRMGSVSPEEQAMVKEALMALPSLPKVLQVIVGPPLVDFGGPQLDQYFSHIQQMLSSQPNSQSQIENMPSGNPAPMQQEAKATRPALNVPNGPM